MVQTPKPPEPEPDRPSEDLKQHTPRGREDAPQGKSTVAERVQEEPPKLPWAPVICPSCTALVMDQEIHDREIHPQVRDKP